MATRVKILTSQNVIGTSAVSSGSDVYSTGAVNGLIGGIVTTGAYLPLSGGSLTGSIYSNTANGGIFGQSIDGSDGLVVSLASTSGQSSTRGGYISVKGNEVTTTGGDVVIEAGNSTLGSGEVKFSTGNILRGYFTKAGKFVLNTNDQGQATYVNTSNDISHSTLISGDQQGRTAIYPGKIEFGPGGSTARDTNLYRSNANELKTDDDFIVGGTLYPKANLYMEPATRIGVNTVDGSDNSYLEINGGGNTGNGRGASVVVYGNEAVPAGNLYLNGGDTSATGGDVIVSTGSGSLVERMCITKAGTVDVAGFLRFSGSNGICTTSNPDGSDNLYTSFSGGGDNTTARGGTIRVYGNEAATHGGNIVVDGGDSAIGGDLVVRTNATERMRIKKDGTIIAPSLSDMQIKSTRSSNAADVYTTLGTIDLPAGSTATLYASVSTEFDSNTGKCIINCTNNAGAPNVTISDSVAYGNGGDVCFPITNGFYFGYTGTTITIYAKHVSYGGGGRIIEMRMINKSIAATVSLINASTWTTTVPTANVIPVLVATDINTGNLVFTNGYISSTGGTISGQLTVNSCIIANDCVQVKDSIGDLSDTINTGYTYMRYCTYTLNSADTLTLNGTLVLL